MGRILIYIVEALLAAGAVGAVLTNRVDGLLTNQPYIALGLEALTLIIGLVVARRSPVAAASFRVVPAFSAVALLTVHAATPAGTIALESSFNHFYFATVIYLAAVGKAHSFLFSLLLLIGTDLGSIALSNVQFVPVFRSLAPTAGLLLAAGALTHFASRTAPWKPPAALTESLYKPIAGGDPKTDRYVPADPDSKILLKTGEYTAEQLGRRHADVKEILASVVYFMARNFDAFSALGFIYDPRQRAFLLNSFRSKSMQVDETCAIALGKGIVGRIGAEKKSFVTGDISAYGGEVLYYKGNSELINSILAVPIISEDKELLGALVVDSKNKRVFSDNHKEVLRRFSGLAAALITNARMRIAQQETARQFQTFYETSQRFTTALSVEQVFNVLFETVTNLTQASRAMAITFDVRQKKGRVYLVFGKLTDIPQGYEFPMNAGIFSYAFDKKAMITINDWAQQGKDYYRFVPDEPRDPTIRSMILLPIMDDESRCLGLLSVESDRPNRFVGKIEQLLSTLAGNASVAITRAMLYQKMERLATTDGLTGLNNHRTFQDILAAEMERSRRYNRTFSLLLMDIDHFKSFNDTYGHQTGDLVLRDIAVCIRQSLRQTDVPARYGGEEFAVILPENDQEGAVVTAERIRQTIESHVVKSDSGGLKVTVSIGCSVYPHQTTEKSQLVECADKALYFSKEHGRNKVTVFRKGM